MTPYPDYKSLIDASIFYALYLFRFEHISFYVFESTPCHTINGTSYTIFFYARLSL